MLINTRDSLPQGVDEKEHTLSIYSVSDYGQSSNKAGIIKINKDLSLVPYLLNNSPGKKGNWVMDLPTKSNINFTSL